MAERADAGVIERRRKMVVFHIFLLKSGIMISFRMLVSQENITQIYVPGM